MWTLLNPIFLWALVAAAIPLILHLMQRRRVVIIPISTIRFLKLAQKHASSRIRLENFLLWLLRTLILALLALAFTLPILRIRSFKQLIGSSQRDVAIVLDVSYSMNYTSGRNLIWEKAKEVAISIIEGLQTGDRICIFLADDDLTPLIEKPTTDLQLALSRLKSVEVKATASQLRSATLAACLALQESGNREREVFIITDGQELPWEEFKRIPSTESTKSVATNEEFASTQPSDVEIVPMQWSSEVIDKETTFFVVALGVASPENSAAVNIEVEPPVLIAEKPAELCVSLSRIGPAQNISVALIIDEQETSRRSVVVQEGMVNNVIFPLPPLAAGRHAGRIETSSDGLMLDNTFYFLLPVREKMSVLCIGTIPDSFFLLQALNPGGNLSPIRVNRVDTNTFPDDIYPGIYSCVFLCNSVPVPGKLLLLLERYVKMGGTLVFFPGDRGYSADYKSWSCLPAFPRVVKNIQPATRTVLRLNQPGDPLFTGMKLQPGTQPIITINREMEFNPLEPAAEIVITTERNEPFLIRRPIGKGQVMCFSTSADRRWSNFPLSPFFLPIVHQIVQFGEGNYRQKPFIWCGRNINLSDFLLPHTGSTEILSPSQKEIKIQKIRAGNEVILNVETIAKPGVYHVRQKAGARMEPVLAVNASRKESNLARIKPGRIPGLLGVKTANVALSNLELLEQIEEHRIGKELAEYFIWLAFLLAILEFFLANRASRKTSTLSEQLSIETSGRVFGKAVT